MPFGWRSCGFRRLYCRWPCLRGDTLSVFEHIKHALDPDNLANPLKILPCRFAEKARAQAPLPSEIQALQTQVRAWNAQQKTFVITGENTQLKTPVRPLLSSKTLNKILDIDTTNYTVTAQSGVSLTTLARALKKAGVHSILPVQKGTLGGVFCAGILPQFYAHVTGLEVLLKDGSYVRYGGKFTKNAAGYPLIRLWAGSQGTLGLVTQLTFKVFATAQKSPKPGVFTPASGNELWSRLICALGETNATHA